MSASALASDALASGSRRQTLQRLGLLGAMAAALAVGTVLDMTTGPAALNGLDVARALLGQAPDAGTHTIVWAIRLPVALMAVAVGMALGLSGAVMQTLLNNPLASSYTLGISAAAGFGAALAIVAGWALPLPESEAIAVNAMVFAGLACAGVYWVGGGQQASAQGLVLAGIALLFLFQALTSLMQMIASPESLQQVVFWLFGSLHKATWPKLGMLAVVVVGSGAWLLPQAWRLTALRLGEARALALGVNVQRLRIQAFVLISVLTGVAVAFVGTIGFVGLVAPHLARMLVGEDQRLYLPASALLGALLLSAASVVGKTVYPGAIVPIGIVTALMGVPFFLWMVVHHRKGLA
jgi:iron complex transport system permease protein